ncbi:MAG: cobalamin-dependent protein, partial [Candidatus Aminicenantes bacterium]|nr:cobalamin-dependent protein [Candidatus Aminicenantes bacterium]
MGLLYLTTAIKQFTDYDIEILDTQPLNWTYSQLENHLKGKAVDVVGITAMTFTLVDVSKTVRLIRQILPKAKIVLGGPHIHLFPSETLNLKGVDFALMGEAEYSFVKFLKNIENTNEYPNIPGLVYKGKEDQIIRNDFIPLNNLDEIPFPKRDLLDVKSYNSLLSRGVLSTIIISSRG